MRTLLLILLFVSTSAIAAEVSRDEAEKMIDEMVRTNMISSEEADKAKVRLHAMSSTEWTAVNKEAEQKAAQEMANEASRAPASVASADPSGNIEKEQLSAIHSDLESISPYAIKNHVVPEAPRVQVAPVVVNPVVVPETQIPDEMLQ
jgi:polyhydroxyalkanoate synthesis regulator phasin